MTTSPIYTSEIMATRALAAEIRHDHPRFVAYLESASGRRPLGTLKDIRCEADHENVDILLEFETASGESCRVGIEAKFDHELTREQVDRELSTVEKLFVLLPSAGAAPDWLATDYPGVGVILWNETLATFRNSRLTSADISSMSLSKSTVDEVLRGLRIGDMLPNWTIRVDRNGNGNPSVVIESPKLPNDRELRGQIQVSGWSTPSQLSEVPFEGFFGIEVCNGDRDFFDPATSRPAPAWAHSLSVLHSEVLRGNEQRYRISRTSARHSKKAPGNYKLALAGKHLPAVPYLPKGYVDWALGPKTENFTVEQLPELVEITVEVLGSWFKAEWRRLGGS